MKNRLIPKSKAKTAYGLLSEISALILAEPKRYNQDTWRYSQSPSDGGPACGTVGCIAGWVATLKPKKYMGVWSNADEVLGLNDQQSGELFIAADVKGNFQTARHARSGAAHIRRFQKQYASQLRRTRV